MFGWVIWKLQLPRFKDPWPRLCVAYEVRLNANCNRQSTCQIHWERRWVWRLATRLYWGKSRLVSSSEAVMWVTGAHTKGWSKSGSTCCFKRRSTMSLLSRYTRWRGWVSGWHVICHHFPELPDGKEYLPSEEWRHKTSTYVLELKDMKVVDWIRANCLSKLMVRMNDFLVLMPDIAIVASWPLSAPSFL